MDSAENQKGYLIPQPKAHVVFTPERTANKQQRTLHRSKLTDDIDDLRMRMAEMFLHEASFTADPVILISRQLDLKINEYMTQSIRHRKAR